jgi:AraC-like DNA-binding protein
MPNQKHPSSNYARILFRHLRLSEDDHRGYFQGTNVSYNELMSLDGTISRNDLARIYRNALAISGNEDLGLAVGIQLHLSSHGPLGVATFSGPNLTTALQLLATYGQTRTEFFDITLSDHPHGLKVCFAETFDLAELRIFVTEAVLSGLFSAIHFFSGEAPFTGQCFFAYPKPAYGDRYKDHFGGEIVFDHGATEIVVPKALLAKPSMVADPVLHQQAVSICQRQLDEIKAGEAIQNALSTQERVASLISENPGQLWTLRDVATKLHISPRTLMRRLDAEGTKFQKVRDELAKEQVIHYLTEPSLSVESIGHLMGFSDTSSFRRSFKRWFGETPAQYMARSRKT